MATLGTLAAGVAHELNNPAAAAQRAAEQLQTVFAARQGADLELGAAGVVAEARSLLTALAEEARRVATGSSGLTPMERADAEAEVEDWLDENGIEKPWELAPVLVEAGKRVGDLVGLRESVGERHLAAVVRWQVDTCRAFQLMEEIRHGSGRISEIVGAMKSYSYLGQAPIQSVDVNEGLRSTLVILRSKLKTGVTVVDELSDDIPRIEAYGGELNQVWTNLIDNAVSAMNGEGRIRLTSMLRGDRVVVSVEDNGPGIPADQQPRVFDAFYTTQAAGGGDGPWPSHHVQHRGGEARGNHRLGFRAGTDPIHSGAPTDAGSGWCGGRGRVRRHSGSLRVGSRLRSCGLRRLSYAGIRLLS